MASCKQIGHLNLFTPYGYTHTYTTTYINSQLIIIQHMNEFKGQGDCMLSPEIVQANGAAIANVYNAMVHRQ